MLDQAHVATLGQGAVTPQINTPTCNFFLHINFPSPVSLDTQIYVITRLLRC